MLVSFVRNIFICSIECKVNNAADGAVCRNFCFFEPGISTERKDQIGEEIKKKEDIATMRYVSAEEAWESYKKDVFQGNEELLEGFEGTIR